MALQGSDLFLLSRAGTLYKETLANLASFIGAGGASPIVGNTVVDFATPDCEKEISFAVVGALTTHSILLQINPIDSDVDNIYYDQSEFSPVQLNGKIPSDDNLSIRVVSSEGLPIVGKYAIRYTLF